MTVNDSLNVGFDIEIKLALIKRDNKGSSYAKLNSSQLSRLSHYQEEAPFSFQLTLFAPRDVRANNNNINARRCGHIRKPRRRAHAFPEPAANEPETRREFPNCSQQSFEALLGRKMLILVKSLKGKSCCNSSLLQPKS